MLQTMKVYSKLVDTLRVMFAWYYRARGVKASKNTLISFVDWIETPAYP